MTLEGVKTDTEETGSPLLADPPEESASEEKSEEGASDAAAEGEKEKPESDLTADQVAELAKDPRVRQAALQSPEGSTMLDNMIDTVMNQGREEGKQIAVKEVAAEKAATTERDTLKAALKSNADGDPQPLADITAKKIADEERVAPVRKELAEEHRTALYQSMDDLIVTTGLQETAQSLDQRELGMLNRDRFRTDREHIDATFSYLQKKKAGTNGAAEPSTERKAEGKAKRQIDAAVAARTGGTPPTNTGKADESEEVSLADFLNEKR